MVKLSALSRLWKNCWSELVIPTLLYSTTEQYHFPGAGGVQQNYWWGDDSERAFPKSRSYSTKNDHIWRISDLLTRNSNRSRSRTLIVTTKHRVWRTFHMTQQCGSLQKVTESKAELSHLLKKLCHWNSYRSSVGKWTTLECCSWEDWEYSSESETNTEQPQPQPEPHQIITRSQTGTVNPLRGFTA